MSPLLLFAALYGVPEAPQDRSGAISKTFAAKICGTTDTLFVTGIQRAFPHSLVNEAVARPIGMSLLKQEFRNKCCYRIAAIQASGFLK